MDANPTLCWRGDVACYADFSAGKGIGLLGLEMHTRRRNRANGIITGAEQGCLHIQIVESYGNCPKHIQVLLRLCLHLQHMITCTLWVSWQGKLAYYVTSSTQCSQQT